MIQVTYLFSFNSFVILRKVGKEDKFSQNEAFIRISFLKIHNFMFRVFKNALGVILIYDVTSEKSFNELSNWLQEIKEKTDPKCVYFLIGTKIDLCEKDPKSRKVIAEEAQRKAEKNNFLFKEISNKTKENLDEGFSEFIEGKFIFFNFQKIFF